MFPHNLRPFPAMDSERGVDIEFDFRSDTPPGKDPDALSPTLRKYHRQLWSKRLPTGKVFELVTTTPRVYLHHKSQVGEFFLSSDSVIPTFTRQPRIAHVIAQVAQEERDAFQRLSHTI